MSKQKKAPPRISPKSKPRLSAKAKRAKATRLEAKPIRMAEETEPDPTDPLAAKSLRDFRSAPGFLHKDDRPELLVQIAELGGNASSVPRGTDEEPDKEEDRLVAVVRERYAEFAKHEKLQSKDLAAALIALHDLEAKPGYGRFQAHLKELGIPRMNAYRLMKIHGWEAPPRNKEGKREPNKLSSPLALDKMISGTIGFFDQFEGEELKEKLEFFVAEVRQGLAYRLGATNGKG